MTHFCPTRRSSCLNTVEKGGNVDGKLSHRRQGAAAAQAPPPFEVVGNKSAALCSSRASARPRSFIYGNLAAGRTTHATLVPLDGDPVPAATLGVVKGFVGEPVELLEIARRPHLDRKSVV